MCPSEHHVTLQIMLHDISTHLIKVGHKSLCEVVVFFSDVLMKVIVILDYDYIFVYYLSFRSHVTS